MSGWESARRDRPAGRFALAAVALAAVATAVTIVAVRTPSTRLPVEDRPTAAATDVEGPIEWSRVRRGLWRQLPDAPLTPRVGHGMVAADGRVFVWGGFDVAGLPLTDGGLFDPSDGTWEVLPPFRGDDASAAYVAWTGTDVVVVSATATHRYDPSQGAWDTLVPPPLPRGHVVTDQVVGADDRVVVLTGPGRDDVEPRPAVLVLRDAGRTWRRLPDPPVRFDTGDVALADGGRIVIATGAAGSRAPAVVELDLARTDDGWTRMEVPPGLGDRRYVRLLGALDGDRTVLVGIGLPAAPGYAAVHDGTAWRRVNAPPLPASPQVDGLPTGEGLIVWNRLTGAGAELDRRSGRWTPFPASPVTDGAPRPAAWTGSSVVTWGGFDQAGALYRVR